MALIFSQLYHRENRGALLAACLVAYVLLIYFIQIYRYILLTVKYGVIIEKMVYPRHGNNMIH